MRVPVAFAALVSLALLPVLAGCGDSPDRPLAVAVIATPEELLADGVNLSAAAQHLRDATQGGLVARNAQGQIVPDLVESWLVTDDGLSYIFRLREARWPDNSEVTAQEVRRSLQQSRSALQGTSLALDLAPIAEIRAMTGRVLEIRLSTPVPDMLMLLAQPELAVRSDKGPLGAMELAEASQEAAAAGSGTDSNSVTLRFRQPASQDLPQDENWESKSRTIALVALDGRTAIERFYDGELDLVLGGGVGYMPLVNTGPLTRGTARVDPAIGLFGLLAQNDEGALASDTLREALAMAIDREALLAQFGVGGWVATTRVVAPGLPNDNGFIAERWSTESLEDRRARATGRLAALGSGDGARTLTIAIGDEPGHVMLFDELARQWGEVGIRLERAEDRGAADLVLIDRVARYADPRWFLNQFHCSLRRGLCNRDVDALVAEALAEPAKVRRSLKLAEAEAALTLDNIYIPLGQPLRWSLARGSVEPFENNPFAFHPLPPIALIPN